MNNWLARVFLLSFAVCAGCAAFWKVAPAVLDTAACALAHKDEPWPQVVIECGITKENEQAILDIIEQQKAREAAIRREVGCKR